MLKVLPEELNDENAQAEINIVRYGQ